MLHTPGKVAYQLLEFSCLLPLLFLRSNGITDACCHIKCYVDSGDLNSGPHVVWQAPYILSHLPKLGPFLYPQKIVGLATKDSVLLPLPASGSLYPSSPSWRGATHKGFWLSPR